MINKFTDLNTWKESHKLVLLTYKTLNNFPQKEMFALSDQIRRCVVSISANIAEGFSRHSKKEKQQFYYISKGSLTELENHFLIAKDVKYIDVNTYKNLNQQLEIVGKLLTGLIHSVL